jgi:hypothetical protein
MESNFINFTDEMFKKKIETGKSFVLDKNYNFGRYLYLKGYVVENPRE